MMPALIRARRAVEVVLDAASGVAHVDADFKTRATDTLLVSYPRSGNTWCRFLIANLVRPGARVDFANIESIVPDSHAVPNRKLARYPDPRIVKSHKPFTPRFRRVLYLVRDPRDVVVSYYYYQLRRGLIGADLTMEAFAARFVAGGVDAYGTWQEHVGGWLGARGGRAGLLLVRYEDLRERPLEELARIAAFAGLAAGHEDLTRAVGAASLRRMQQAERTSIHRWRTERRYDPAQPFVRRGAAGGWRHELDPGSARRIEAAWAEAMTPLGYD
jgi:hypothetical protein